jgi:RNA-splicing ligase RtcB
MHAPSTLLHEEPGEGEAYPLGMALAGRHRGGDCRVVRKGATPTFPGQRGFVGGSIGEISVILRGDPYGD